MERLTKEQARVLEALSTTEPRSAYGLDITPHASLSTLWALVNKGAARDVTKFGAGAMFSPRSHYKFVRTG